MTLDRIYGILVALVSAALAAQQAQAPNPAPKAPATVATSVPAQLPATNILQDGTPMKLRQRRRCWRRHRAAPWLACHWRSHSGRSQQAHGPCW